MNPKVHGLDINLREELDELHNEYGHDVILVRTSKVTCSCTRSQGQQASDKCPKCLGIGRVIRLEKVTIIDEVAAQVQTLPNNEMAGLVGEVYSDAKAFYLKYYIHPVVGDYIYEVTWNGKNIGKVNGIYKIEWAEPLRMDNGRMEYYRAVGHREAANVILKQQFLKRLPIRRG